MDTLLNDLRFALRTFSRNRGFAVVALLTLAIGVGTNTAIFSLVNATLLQPLPYDRPESLVVLHGNVQRQVVERRGTSFPDFFDWRSRNRTFDGMSAFDGLTFTLREGGEPERVAAELVSGSYFRLLGLTPAAGRLFGDEDDGPAGASSVVISDGLWTRRFGRRPDVVGRLIRFDARSLTVIGVAPPGFRGLTEQAEVWVTTAGMDPRALAARGSRGFPVLGRLKAGVSMAQAQEDMTRVARELEREYPDTNEARGVEVITLSSEVIGNLRPALFVVLAAVGVVLLIACANVASLLLARAEVRGREMAIRTALGANRRRVYRQLATESTVLAVAAAVLALLTADWMTGALLAASPVTLPGFVNVGVDSRVLLFTLGVSTLVGVALGLAPAWQVSTLNVQATLKSTSDRGSTGPARQWFRQTVVVAQVALAVVLLTGAGLLFRTLLALNAVDPGFAVERVLTLRVGLPALPSSAAASDASAAPAMPAPAPVALTLLERLSGVAGVERIDAGSDSPLSGEASAVFYSAEGQPAFTAQDRPRAYIHRVTPGFFQTMGAPLVAGRSFDGTELSGDNRNGVVIVSEAMVRRFWPGQDPIGKRIKIGAPDSPVPWLSIVGVVGDLKYRALPRNPTADPDLFIPFAPNARGFALIVRTRLDPDAMVGTLRREIRQAEPAATLFNIATISERVRSETRLQRFISWLTGIFAGVALLLAAIGVYGVLAQSVVRRTPEIAVRLALGATRAGILRLVTARAGRLTGAGLAAGLVLSLALMRVIERFLFGVTASDPVTLASVTGLLALVAALATCLPVIRATRIQPVAALRSE